VAGFREFVTGEVLTAANVDDFLAKQAVMKFADAAARDAALGATVGGGNALRQGMVAYLDDSNDLLKYDGDAWTNVGGLVAVKSAIFTGTQTASVTGGSNVAVTDLTITHEVADASNKLIISAFLGAAGSSRQAGNVGIAVNDGTNLIGVGAAAGNRSRVSAGGFVMAVATGTTSIVTMPSITFVHSPGSGSKTYTVRAVNVDADTQTIFINRTEADGDLQNVPRAVSSLVIQEVKV
jgi:hypothetical protein